MTRRRRGTVFIAESIHSDPPGLFGYWEAAPDGPPAMLEEMPDLPISDVDAAVRWGRERAEVVLVRLTTREHYFSAGDREPPGARLDRWPPPASVLTEIEEERRAFSAALRAERGG